MAAITTIKQMRNRLKSITSEKVLETLSECFVFAFSQLKDHTNSSAVSDLVGLLGSIAKRPNGCTAKNLISFMASNGFEFDKKKGSFSLQDRALFAEFDYDSAITFWTEYQIETIKLTSIEQFEKFLTKNKEEITVSEAIQMVNKIYNIRELQNVA